MKGKALWLILSYLMVVVLLLVSCTRAASEDRETQAPQVEGDIVVNSTADSGPGTLRQALLDAQSGDIITFDPAVFPPTTPATVYICSELPPISQGDLTIDGSNAGVILDGSKIGEDFVPGLQVISNGNRVQGLQIVNFIPGAGIVISGGSQNNTVGGDRSIGSGPLGQGNLVSNGDIGIGLWGDGTSFNTITGNLIGTDTTGTKDWGNNVHGIYIGEGASHNIAGPDNIIAYNNEPGIAIHHSNSLGNTITQNSIHDNTLEGIHLGEGGNTELSTPFIFDFDLAAGTVTGAACSNCIIEIFSDSDRQGKVYEGKTETDGNGAFAFDKGTSFTGPHLTATVTDVDGNTSGFSVPTSGISRALLLQEGNGLPKSRIQARQSRELADNRIGSQWSGLWQCDEAGLQHILNDEILQGLKRVRLSINHGDVDKVNWTFPEFSIDPSHDSWITSIAEGGVTITYMLCFWDKAGRAEGKAGFWDATEDFSYSRFKTEDEIQAYLDFVRFIVNHFKDRVQYYEILNEPETPLPGSWVEVADYVNLVKRTVPVIREEYPEAKIVAGATSDLEYFLEFIQSDAMPLVDAISWHPIYGQSPEHKPEYYYNYPSVIQEIKDVASAHGFKGEFIADELNWLTPLTAIPGHPNPIYGETASAKYYARGIVMHLGMDVTVGVVGVNPLVPTAFSTVQGLCTIMAGTKPIDLPVEIKSEATNIRSYGFSLPNGDRLLTLWTDGVAVDNDPGVEATVTLFGLSGHKVLAIDILNSFQQELVTSTEDGNLVIQNLLVKDYPIILHLID